ncbi:hypothetical protein ACA910_006681 [Epithemia clementina (nom. ined.)]
MATAIALGLGVAAASYMLGLWDRPKFAPGQLLEDDDGSNNANADDANSKRPWYAIVALSNERNIGKHIMALIDGTRKGIESLSNGSKLLEEGCNAYMCNRERNKDNIPDSLCIGFFFNDPKTAEHPSWAIGWAVREEGLTLEKLQSLVRDEVQPNSGLPNKNEIRVIRLPGETPIFHAKIPWRVPMTPMIAPMLHWKRALSDFVKGGYPCENGEGPVCMEIYVLNHKKKWFTSYIDYALAYGNNSTLRNDALK